MITANAFASIKSIDREQWNDCFAGTLEDWDYYLAVEQGGVAGFQWRYLVLFDGPQLLAAVPAFITAYSLDTTLQGPAKHLTQALRRRWPGALQLGLYALGSPVAERCHAGVASHLPAARRPQLYQRLLALARQDANCFDIGLLAVKDAPVADPPWITACQAAGLQSMPSLPGGWLEVGYASLDEYLGSLGKATRKDLRRLLRSPGPQVEWRHNIDDVLPDIMRLYEATLARSELQFERLGEGYFTAILRQLKGRAACVLYRVDGQLVAFNLLLVEQHRLIDKFFAHDLQQTREHNLYARSWLTNVQYCIDHGIATYECGQAGYASKIRFGCRFDGNMLFFRHRNGLINALLKRVTRFIRPDRHDPAMAAASSEHS